KVQRLEPLLIGQVSKRGSRSRVKRRGTWVEWAGNVDGEPLENSNAVQIAGLSRPAADAGAGKGQLPAGRTVRRVSQKIETQQWVIIEHTVRRANHGLAVAFGIPRQTDARLHIVGVSLNAFLQPQQVVGRKRESLGRLELGRNLYVVAHPKVQSEVG